VPAYDARVNDNAPRAGSVYAAALEPVSGAKAWTLAWVTGLLTATAAFIGWWDSPAIGDLVVRRTADAAEVVRTGAGDQEEAAQLLAHLQRQLQELDATEFEAAWGLESVGS
jgi:hypothetical protein